MAVNLATKYSSQIAEVFTAGSFIKGKTSTSFDLTGVKTLKVYTPITVPEVDYVREGTSRYGTVTEMQDIVQELMMTQDKAFTLLGICTCNIRNSCCQKIHQRILGADIIHALTSFLY